MFAQKMKNTNIAISFVNHNASVCVMTDNNVELFIQAERITREKNGQFVNTSNFQTTVESIDTNQPVDNLILIDAPNETIVKEITNFFTSKGISIKTTTITQGHHLFHALSGFYMSGFSEASIMVCPFSLIRLSSLLSVIVITPLVPTTRMSQPDRSG